LEGQRGEKKVSGKEVGRSKGKWGSSNPRKEVKDGRIPLIPKKERKKRWDYKIP